MKKIVPQDAQLYEVDSENQTLGCRHTQPNICSNNNLRNVCSFVNKDQICRKPPRSWKAIYFKLKADQQQIQ